MTDDEAVAEAQAFHANAVKTWRRWNALGRLMIVAIVAVVVTTARLYMWRSPDGRTVVLDSLNDVPIVMWEAIGAWAALGIIVAIRGRWQERMEASYKKRTTEYRPCDHYTGSVPPTPTFMLNNWDNNHGYKRDGWDPYDGMERLLAFVLAGAIQDNRRWERFKRGEHYGREVTATLWRALKTADLLSMPMSEDKQFDVECKASELLDEAVAAADVTNGEREAMRATREAEKAAEAKREAVRQDATVDAALKTIGD